MLIQSEAESLKEAIRSLGPTLDEENLEKLKMVILLLVDEVTDLSVDDEDDDF